MKPHSLILAAVGIGLFAAAVRADEWPQWRGPKRDGISKETGLLKAWPKEGPKLLWQLKNVGAGYGTPAVAGNRLYLMSNEGIESESVRAFDIRDGKPVWSIKIGKVGNPDQQPNYPGARSTPSVDGKFVYAFGSDGDLACLAIATGKIVWKKNVRTEFGGKPGTWAYAESPLVDGNRLVVTPGGEQATLLAVDKRTGAVLWKSAVPGGDEAGYSSIVPMEVGGVRQYAQFMSKGVVGVNAATGKFLWRYDKSVDTRFGVNAITPVASGPYVFSSAAAGGGLAHITGANGSFTAESVYVERKAPTGLGGAVKVGNYLYGTTTATLLCIEYATGKVRWEERSVGAGSVCYADGLLYVHGENGEIALVEATPDGYHEKGRFTPPNQPERGQSKAWPYPVVSNGRLYIRDLNAVWAYDVRQ